MKLSNFLQLNNSTATAQSRKKFHNNENNTDGSIKINTQTQPLSEIPNLPIYYNIPAFNILNKSVLNAGLTEEEYNNTLNKVEQYSVPLYSTTGYNNIPQKLRGIIPYAGLMDKSNIINQFLSGRNTDENYIYATMTFPVEKTKIKNMIRVLDYSLNKLDEEYGKYDGIVYRTGIINPASPQYYSTSGTQEGAIFHNCSALPDKQDYNIIYTKSGHKIYEFQKQSKSLLSEIFSIESEVLLDRKSGFKQIPNNELTPDMLAVRKSFLDKILKIYSLKHGTKEVEEILSNKKRYTDLLSKIKIWENT